MGKTQVYLKLFGLLFTGSSEGTFNGNNCAFANLCLNQPLFFGLESLTVTLI